MRGMRGGCQGTVRSGDGKDLPSGLLQMQGKHRKSREAATQLIQASSKPCRTAIKSWLPNSSRSMTRTTHILCASETTLRDSISFAANATRHFEEPISPRATRNTMSNISHVLFVRRCSVLKIRIMSMTIKFVSRSTLVLQVTTLITLIAVQIVTFTIPHVSRQSALAAPTPFSSSLWRSTEIKKTNAGIRNAT